MKFIFYKGNDSQWYWKLVAGNGSKVADGAEGYQTKSGVIKAILRVQKALIIAAVLEEQPGAE